MRRRLAIMATGLVFLLCFGGGALAAPALFEGFVLGAPKSELAKLPGATPGEGDFAGDILLPEAHFAGMPWNVRLEFTKDRLTRVSLMERYSRARLDAVTAKLKADRFEMLSVLVDNSFLDMVKILKIKGPDGVKEEWYRFMKDKNPPKRMIYAWFDLSGVSKDLRLSVGSVQQLLLVGPAETREAEVILLRDPASSAPGMLLVDFSFPALQRP